MAKRVASLYAELGLKTDKFKREAEQSKRDLKGMGQEFTQLGGLAKAALAGGVVTGAVAAGKAIYDMARQGAVVEQTGESFEFMSRKVGLADDILEQLRRASRGTIDDLTLMSSTTTLLAGASDELAKELGDATPELLRIAKAANKLNPSLGSTAFLYESISTGIKRASPLILDNLGLTISIGEANEAYAQSLGKTVKELTEEEKKVALLNATLKAGGNLINQVGGNVDSAADDFARMEVQVKNLKDEWSTMIAGPVSETAGVLAGAIGEVNKHREAYEKLQDAIDKGIITQEEANEATRVGRGVTRDYAAIQEFVTQKTKEWREELNLGAEATGWAAGQNRELKRTAVDVADALEEEALKMSDMADAFSEIDLSVRGPIGSQLEDFAQEQEEYKQKAIEVQNEIDELNSLDYLSKEQEAQLDKAKKKMDEINASIQESIKAHEEAQKRLVFDILTDQIRGMEEIDPQLAVRATGEIANQLGLVDDETVRVMGGLSEAIAQLAEDENIYRFGQNVEGVIDDIGKQTDEGETYIQDLKAEILDLEGVYTVDIVINQTGSVPAVGNQAKKKVGSRQPRRRQHGGPVGVNMPYLVGETGPELFVPGVSGQIVPGGIGGDTIIIHNHSEGAAALSNAMIEDRRRARLNASMTR